MVVKTEYKGVYKNGHTFFNGVKKENFKATIIINKQTFRSYHQSLKEAAIQIDKWLILSGKEPVNILKRK